MIKTLLLLVSFLFIWGSAVSSQLYFNTNNITGSIPVKNWKMLRDSHLIKQNLDYSCGAASIATILTKYYKRPITEKRVLELLVNVTKKKGAASFADMQKILPELGFKGIGLATSWEQLLNLKIPVLAYVKQRKQDHFTVLSGINKTHVKLSDPSLGNRILTRGQFKKIWETRDQKGFEGKMLAIIPLEKHLKDYVDKKFFTSPKFSSIPKELLIIQR